MPSVATSPRDWSTRGPLLLVVSSVLFGVMAVLAKQAARHAPGPQIALVRFVVGGVGTGIYFVLARRAPVLVNKRGLILRGSFGGLAVLGFFVAIWKLPVGLATLLNYTSPVATAFFAAMFLGERIHGVTVAALVFTSTGLVLVVNAHAPAGHWGFGLWELVGVASAIMSGAAVTAIRWSRRTDGSWEVFGAFCVIGAFVCAPLAVATWQWSTPTGWALMLAVGTVTLGAQILFTYALGHVNAATAGVLQQIAPVTAIGLGILIFGEASSWESLVGAATTLTGVALGAWGERAATAAPPPAAAATGTAS